MLDIVFYSVPLQCTFVDKFNCKAFSCLKELFTHSFFGLGKSPVKQKFEALS